MRTSEIAWAEPALAGVAAREVADDVPRRGERLFEVRRRLPGAAEVEREFRHRQALNDVVVDPERVDSAVVEQIEGVSVAVCSIRLLHLGRGRAMLARGGIEQALRPVDRGEDEADQRPLLWSDRNRMESLACRTKGLYGLVAHNCDGNSETGEVVHLSVDARDRLPAVPRRLLVVATASVPPSALRASVRAHAGEDAETLVVAPASDISRLDWLTNADADARTDGAERADELAAAAPTGDVQSCVGDSDPLKAIEDALRTFAADEMIVVTRPDEDAAWLEKGSAETALSRFSLPVTHLVVEE